ncbi:MAG: SpoIIE family protein phosphatase [Leptospiraceae bacterium]|nr:SpoIIE family protein phosphatase [Leptospiraceae bacterium]MCP5493590.1 SpoIIE family protein phosphatase [Leptospiraceae bacterium]
MIYFNAWAVATFICCTFHLLVVLFLLTIKNKSLSTKYLGYFMFGVFLLSFGFFWSAIFPSPLGGYHRFITIFAIFPLFINKIRFAYHFLGNFHPKESRIMVIILSTINILAIIQFYWQALHSKSEFIFIGEIFDYLELGKFTALLILFYVFWFVIVMIRKARFLKGRERNTLLQSIFAILLLTLGPSIGNMLMKRETITPALFHQLYVTFLLLGGFAIVIVFINNAVEKTTFMTKIVGISVVTFLLIIQGLSSMINYLNNKNFDRIHSMQTASLLNSKDYQNVPNLAYLVSFPIMGNEEEQPNVLFQGKNVNLNLLELKGSFLREERNKKRYNKTMTPKTTELYYGYRVVDKENQLILEAGYSYYNYREFMNESASFIIYYTIVTVILIIVLFPLFFSVSLIRPLNALLGGVTEVNNGNLSIEIPVMVQDEIGYLSESFNGMVKNIRDSKNKLMDYAENLEQKVKERTKEIRQKMEEIHQLKVQQDGDYFLTSLIQKPLITNWNKSTDVSTTIYIEQKKKFSFRDMASEVGGDICITGNLRFRSYSSRHVFFMNGDAMGKSMQGAGGAIVLGTAMNNILSRSASHDKVLDVSPKEWLIQTFHELNNIFYTFDGLMMASAVVGLIHPDTGNMLYFNAEHPWTVLYRDGSASFIEDGILVRKLGSPSEFEFQVKEFKLHPGDVLFVGSDGRDDINLEPEKSIRVINEDETLFLRIVEESKGEIDKIVEIVHSKGVVTDDLSIMRIGFKEKITSEKTTTSREKAILLYESGRHNIELGNFDEGVGQLKEAVSLESDFHEAIQLLAQFFFGEKNYEEAIIWIEAYLKLKPDATNFWFYLSVCAKHLKDFQKAIESGEKVFKVQPYRMVNLINLADSYRMIGEYGNSRFYLNKALKQESYYEPLQKLDGLLQERGA